MKALHIFLFTFFCFFIQVLPAQNLQLLGIKGSVILNSDMVQSSVNGTYEFCLEPYYFGEYPQRIRYEIGAIASQRLSKSFNLMYEGGLRNFTYNFSAYSCSSIRQHQNHTLLYGKAKALYGIISKEQMPIPNLYAAVGVSLGKTLFLRSIADSGSPSNFHWLLGESSNAFQFDPFVEMGYCKRILPAAMILIQPVFSPRFKNAWEGSNIRDPWLFQLHVSCIWQLK